MQRFRDWLNLGKVSVKREDAVKMLRVIQDFNDSGVTPFRASFSFRRTEAWDADMSHAAAIATDSAGSPMALQSDVLEELRLQGGVPDDLRVEVLSRVLALREANRRGLRPAEEDFGAARTELRRKLEEFSDPSDGPPGADALSPD